MMMIYIYIIMKCMSDTFLFIPSWAQERQNETPARPCRLWPSDDDDGDDGDRRARRSPIMITVTMVRIVKKGGCIDDDDDHDNDPDDDGGDGEGRALQSRLQQMRLTLGAYVSALICPT